tara:strand:+ start:346 stop:504 length:159 start_codon:yes stop_codon:yes gene_type:complete
MSREIIFDILLSSLLMGQFVDDNGSYKNLTDAIKFAYENNLNAAIVNFTGFG